jgi:hypothetical protein
MDKVVPFVIASASEAIHEPPDEGWIASLLAMTRKVDMIG